MSVPHSCAS